MSDNKLQALEAVIFAGGEPTHIEKIAQAMQLEHDEVLVLIGQLKAKYDHDDSGIRLSLTDGCYQICTKSEYADYVRRAFEIRRNAPISNAALEVLAVIAYNQPVTRAFIDTVRGVDCSGVVGSLNEKGLIEEKGRLDLPGRPLLYGTTNLFLRSFGITSLEELPPLPDTDELNALSQLENSEQLALDLQANVEE